MVPTIITGVKPCLRQTKLQSNKKPFHYTKLFIKLAITIGLSTYILYHVKIDDLKSIVRNANAIVLLVVFVAMFINIVVSAKKWQILLKIHNIRYHLSELTKFYLTGGFFSNFLPSTIGGDTYRVYKTLGKSTSKSGAVLSVITERIFGLIILLFLGLIASVGSYFQFRDPISTFGISFGAAGFLFLFVLIWILSLRKPREWLFERPRVPQKLKTFFSHIGDYRRDIPNFFYFLIFSAGFYILLFIYRYALIRSFGEVCPFFSLAMIIMISNIVATLPISINGIGVLEGSFIFLVTEFGITYETALMVMITQRLMAVSLSLVGGVLFYFDKDQRLPAEEANAKRQAMDDMVI